MAETLFVKPIRTADSVNTLEDLKTSITVKPSTRLFGADWKKFWGRLPRRLWNFYIECLIIPSYRDEWGIYRNWSYRAPKRVTVSFIKKQQRKLEKKEKAEKEKRAYSQLEHDHSLCERVKINVNGVIYETQLKTLQRYPNTLLGNPNKRIRYFNPEKNEYFFDRHRQCFEFILYYYQSGGKYQKPEHIPMDIFLEESEFFGIDDDVIQNYRKQEGYDSTKDSMVGCLPNNLLSRKIWLLLDFPESSIQASVVAMISILTISISVFIFCAETLDIFSPTTALSAANKQKLKDPFFFTETSCCIWFTVEYFVRFIASPNKFVFVRSALNLVDLTSILPFYLQLLSDSTSASASFGTLRVIRLVRVFRIFKLSRHSRGLKVLGKTMQASISELFLLVFFVIIGVILFASTVYFSEQSVPDSRFTSVPEGFWYAMATMTTVGYGDLYPRTLFGKVVGSVCAIAGVLTIALPVPVIVSNFNFYYHQAMDTFDYAAIKKNHIQHCPFLGQSKSGSGKYGEISEIVPSVPSFLRPYKQGKRMVQPFLVLKPGNMAEVIIQTPIVPSSSESDFESLLHDSQSRGPMAPRPTIVGASRLHETLHQQKQQTSKKRG